MVRCSPGYDLHNPYAVTSDEAYARLLIGLPRDRIVGRSPADLAKVIPSDLSGYGEISQQQDQKLLREPGVEIYEVQLDCADGVRRDFRLYEASIKDATGHAAGLIGVMADITELKQAEQALQESQRTLATLIGNLPGMAYRCRNNEAWTMEFISDGCLELTGYSPTDLILDKKVAYGRLIHPDDRDMVWQKVQAALQENRRYQMTYRLITASGEEKWMWEQGNGVAANEEGVVLEGFIADITELKQVEEALRVSEERFALAAQGANDGLWDWDVANQKLYWSPRLKEILGYADDELEVDFETFETLLHPDDIEQTRAAIAAHLQQRQPYNVEYRVRTKSGDYRWDGSRGQAVWDESGNPLRMVGFTSDITERRRVEAALQEYSEHLEEMVEQRTAELELVQEQLLRREKLAVLGQLAGGVAHELRGPLGNIKNASYLLNLILPEPEPTVKEVLELLDQEVAISERIIDSLLDFARTKTPARRAVDINALVQEVLLRTSAADLAAPAEIVIELADGLPAVQVDPDQIDRVFDNLIRNAFQSISSPPAGRLRIKTALLEPGWVTVSFNDNGAGIAPENLPRIFEPLFTTRIKGIGLGLALVQNLVEANGGRVEVASEVGQGSTFKVKLPVD